MAADVYTEITFQGTKDELIALIKALKAYEQEHQERYKKDRDCAYIDIETVGRYISDNEISSCQGDELDEESIEKLVGDGRGEILVSASGPYGVYFRLGDLDFYKYLAEAAPNSCFKGESSGFLSYAEVSLRAELKDGELKLIDYYMPDDELPELYAKDVKEKLPYAKFCSMFVIDKDSFDEEDYDSFIEEAFGDEGFPDMDYEEFVEICDASHISEERYETVKEKLEEKEFVDFDEFREELDTFDYSEIYIYDPVTKKKIV